MADSGSCISVNPHLGLLQAESQEDKLLRTAKELRKKKSNLLCSFLYHICHFVLKPLRFEASLTVSTLDPHKEISANLRGQLLRRHHTRPYHGKAAKQCLGFCHKLCSSY